MRTVAREEIDRWCLSNERDIWPESRTVRNPVTLQDTVKVWQRVSQSTPHSSVNRRTHRPWYQRQPQRWFRPLFSALLFIHERRWAFIFIIIFALVFGVAWWVTSGLLL